MIEVGGQLKGLWYEISKTLASNLPIHTDTITFKSISSDVFPNPQDFKVFTMPHVP